MPIKVIKPSSLFIETFTDALLKRDKTLIQKYIQTAYIERYVLDFRIFEREIRGLDEEDAATDDTYFTYPLIYITELYEKDPFSWFPILERLLECQIDVNVKDWKGDSAIQLVTKEFGDYEYILAKKILDKGGNIKDIHRWNLYWIDRLGKNPSWTLDIREMKRTKLKI